MAPVVGNRLITLRRPPPLPALHRRDPALFLNRELSWLEFNRRVLHEALDPRTPLLERVKFLAIFASNLDEFFQVRVAGLREQVLAGVSGSAADRTPPEVQLGAIRRTVVALLVTQTACLRDDLIPELAAHGIVLHERFGILPVAEQERLTAYFHAQVAPLLVHPDRQPAHQRSYIPSLSLALAVSLAEAPGPPQVAWVTVPKLLPRWIPVSAPNTFIPLECLIGAHLDTLFSGRRVLEWHAFRITRNTALNLELSSGPGDEAEDLLELIQEEVRNRRFGEVVRLEVQASMSPAMRSALVEELNEADAGEGLRVTAADVFAIPGPLDLSDLAAIANIDAPELKDPPFTPGTPPGLAEASDVFAALRDGDILLHHPYHSFEVTVERFIAQAADDPDVRAIKITLYRTGGEIARLLAHAAERGKRVTVLIELQARFDEENNINWAKHFEKAGVQVSYGIAGLKTHAKVALIERHEDGAIRRYLHIGSGNYSRRTARGYTDFGLLSADPGLGADLSDLFDMLTGFGTATNYRKLVVAPRWLKPSLLALIRREADHGRAGRPARILAKMNALVDDQVIEALYEASQAGVAVDLIVRGICCLRPGVPGVSKRIRVVSILGRFLEHSRAFSFRNGGKEECYISSADWMPRNLIKRVETAVPIEDPKLRAVLQQWMEAMLRDNRQAWDLRADGNYTQRAPAPGEPERGSHRMLAEAGQEASTRQKRARPHSGVQVPCP